MTIAVIIPTLNEEKTLTQTLTQVTALDLEEIIVVDGGSTDLTLRLAEAFSATTPHVHLITGPMGRARQMNAGAKESRSEILLFLHADTILPPNVVGIIRTAMADSNIAGGWFEVRFDSSSTWGAVISRFMNWRSRLSGIATGDQTIFVRRPIFEQLGGYSDIPLMEDIEFSARLKRVGSILALEETVTTSFRRWEQQGPLRTILLMWTLRFLYWIGMSPHRLKDFYAAIR